MFRWDYASAATEAGQARSGAATIPGFVGRPCYFAEATTAIPEDDGLASRVIRWTVRRPSACTTFAAAALATDGPEAYSVKTRRHD
jgi:hypothetical protein